MLAHRPQTTGRLSLLAAAALLTLLGLGLPHPPWWAPTAPPGGLWAALGSAGTAHAQTSPPPTTPTPAPRAPTRIIGDIAVNTTWALSQSPFRVVTHMTVKDGAVLTIEAGVEVRVVNRARITVGKSNAGSLVAVGTAAQPIVFTSDTATGSWAGLRMQSGTLTTTRLEHVRIERSRYGIELSGVPFGITLRNVSIQHVEKDGIYFERANPILRGLTISNVGEKALHSPDSTSFQLRDSTVRGALFLPTAVNATLQNNTFHDLTGSRLPPHLVAAVGASSSGTTPKTVIEVMPGTIAQDTSWSALTYRIMGQIAVGGTASPTLSLAGGTTFRFADASTLFRQNPRLVVGYTGSGGLVAVGTATAPIRFTADVTDPTKPFWWSGLLFGRQTLATTRLEHLEVEAAITAISLQSTPAGITLRSGTIRRIRDQGIEVRNASPVLDGWTLNTTAAQRALHITGTRPFTLRRSTLHGTLYAPRVTSATLANNTFRGGFHAPAMTTATWTQNTFANYSSWTARVHPHLVSDVVASISDATADTVVEVVGATVERNLSWPVATFRIMDRLTIEGTAGPTLTLTPGATLRFATLPASGPGNFLTVGSTAAGGLVAVGTATAPIRFTADATPPVAGSWGGIALYSKTLASTRLERIEVELARTALHLKGTPVGVTLQNGTVRKVRDDGIRVEDASPVLDGWTLDTAASQKALHITGTLPLTLRRSTLHGALHAPLTTSATLENNTFRGGFHAPAMATATWTQNSFANYSSWTARVHPNLVSDVAASIPGATAQTAIEVEGSTLSRSASWPARSYVIRGRLAVGGSSSPTLSLAGGAVMRFAVRGSGMALGGLDIAPAHAGAGGLIVQGTAGQPVLFTSDAAEPTAGAWGGVVLHSGTLGTSRFEYGSIQYPRVGLRLRGSPAGVTLRHGTVEHASVDGISFENTSPVLDSWSFSKIGRYALHTEGASSFTLKNSHILGTLYLPRVTSAIFQNNTFSNAFAPRVHPNFVAAFAAGLSAAARETVIEVTGGTLSASTSWPARVYRVVGSLDIAHTSGPSLTLTAGTTLRFEARTGITVGAGNPGGLVAVGTATAPILFTADATPPTAGAWRSIQLHEKTLATSRLEGVVVEYATQGLALTNVPSGVTLRGGTIRHTSADNLRIEQGTATLDGWMLSHAGGNALSTDGEVFTLKNSTLRGVLRAPHAKDGILEGNTFHDATTTQLHLNLVGALADGLAGATRQTAVSIPGGVLSRSSLWPARTYRVGGVLRVEGDTAPILSLEAGTTLRIGDGTLLIGVFAAGGLVAVGTTAAPILFTADAATPTAGSWGTLYLGSQTTATSRLENIIIEYNQTGITLSGNPSGVTLRHGTIRNVSKDGIRFSATSPTLEHWSITEVGLNALVSPVMRFSPAIKLLTVRDSTLEGGLHVPGVLDAVFERNVLRGTTPAAPDAPADSWQVHVPVHLVAAVAASMAQATAQTELWVYGSAVERSAAWPARIYHLPAGLTVRGRRAPLLTLAAGASLRFAKSTSLSVGGVSGGDSGGVVALGTAAAPVTFTSDLATPTAGAWEGISLSPRTISSTQFEHVVVDYGRTSFDINGIPPGVTFRHGVIRNTAHYGVRIREPNVRRSEDRPVVFDDWEIAGGASPGFFATTSNFRLRNSSVTGGIWARFATDAVLDNNTFPGFNTTNSQLHPQIVAAVAAQIPEATAKTVISVASGTIERSTAWPARVYHCHGGLTIAGDTEPVLTLAPGSTLRFEQSSLQVGSGNSSPGPGGLVAVGTAAAPILFTVIPDSKLGWGGLYFFSNTSTVTHLEHVVLEHAATALDLHGVPSGVTLRHGTVRHAGTGISLRNTSPHLSHWTISSPGGHGLVSWQGAPQLSHLTISGAGANGAHLNGFSGRLEHSTISAGKTDGVECIGGGRIELFDNRITGNTGRGIACSAAAHIERNTITGNGVGVELTAAPALLALHHNDLSGNTVPMKSSATAGADARWNWWGSAAGPSGIVGQARTRPWLGAAPTSPFRIERAVASPASFAPGGSASTATVTARTPEAATWSLVLRNGAGTTMRSFTGTGTAFTQAWDGKNTASQTLPAGSYRYTLSARPSAAGGTAAAPVVGDLTLVAGDLVAEIASPGPEARLPQASSLVVRGRALGTGFSAFELDYAAGVDPGANSFTRIARGTAAVATAATLGTWKTSSLSQGIYTLRLRTLGAGSAAVEERVTVALLGLGAVAVSPGHFSPNGDGRRDEVTAVATATARGDWTAQVRDAAGTALRSYGGAGGHPRIVWDGRNTAGTRQSDGTYTLALRMAVDAGNAVEATGTVVLDATAPQAVITAPAANATLLDYEETVTGTASDTHFASYQLRTTAGGYTVAHLKRGTTAVVAGTLGTLADEVYAPRYRDGISYQLELAVEDRAGNRTTATRVLRLDRIRLSSFHIQPRSIDPEQDQRTHLTFRLNRAATVTVQLVAARTGGTTYTLVDDRSVLAGRVSTTWNGKNAAGRPAARDLYQLRIAARDAAGRSAVYDASEGPIRRFKPAWSEVRFNGKVYLAEAPIDPYRNDELRIDYKMSEVARHSLSVMPRSTALDGQKLPLRDLAPVPEGASHVVWTGRLANGKPYTGPFDIYLDVPQAVSELSIVVWSPAFRVEHFRANPYVLRPIHAQVVHLSYELRRAARVQIDVVDPDGNHWLQLQEATVQQPGPYRLEWSGRNAKGKIAAEQGLYTVEVTATETGGRGDRTVRRGNLLMYR